ncbi:MAG TPA: O-antigen ligase family protein [Gemmatimonadaceae bacterium]|nr:O-antigen ligase family protein [Gemmatimonadaceae bacterium]
MKMRRPWVAFLILFGLFAIAGPYDWNNRVNKEAEETNLKATLSNANAGIEEGKTGRRLAVIGFAVLALGITLRRRWNERRGFPVDSGGITFGVDRSVALPILAFVLFAASSVLWAEDPALVVRRVAVFLFLGYAAWAIARSWTLPDILTFTVVSCLVVLFTSLGLEVIRGQFHPFDGEYRLMGLTHPNNHAQECAAVIFCSIAAMRLMPQKKRFYMLTTILAFGFILLTRSRTSFLAVIVALGFGALYIMPKRRVFGVGLVLAALVLVVSVYGPDLVDSAKHALLMGRQESAADVGTLTGRTELWAELLTYVGVRPVLGYGFEGFWGPIHTANVSLALGWVVPHAHNGYIEMLLDLGSVGLMLFVVALLSGVFHAQRRLRMFPGDTEALFSITLLVWVLVSMVSEKVLPQTHYAAFLTMVVLAREAITAPVPVAQRRAIRAYARTVSA